MTASSLFDAPPVPKHQKNSKRLIIAPNLDLVRRLHAVIGGPEPVEYSDYALEHGMYLPVTEATSPSWDLKEVARSTSKTVEVFTNPELEFNLYTVADESTYPHPPHDQPDGGWIWPSVLQKPLSLPWSPKASFLTDQLWLIGSNGFAYNLRDRKCETGAKIDLNAPAST